MVPVLIDSDTGVDDALGLVHVLATYDHIVGITTVWGNGTLADCTRHALIITEQLGSDVPVVPGAARPLVGDPYYVPHIHGQRATGGADLPDPTRRASNEPYLEFIRRLAHEYSGELVIAAVGPLTNLGLAFATYPELASHVRRVVWMGGAVERSGNDAPTGEANAIRDPEAAEIVMASGVEVWMLPLDVTDFVCLQRDELDRIAKVDTPGARHLAAVVPLYLDFYESVLGVPEAAMHSGLAMSIAIDPSLVTDLRRLEIHVELDGRRTRGMTVVDRRPIRGRPHTWREADVATHWIRSVDVGRYRADHLAAVCAKAVT